jgi:O-antigen/teichoic acid export membrane protein
VSQPTLDHEGTGRRRTSFVRAAAGTFGTNLAVATLSLVNVLIVARVLGATGRGQVAFLITIASLAGFFGAAGVQESNANIGGSEPGLRPRLATNSIFLALGFGTIVALAIAALVIAFPAAGGDVQRILLWITLASIPAVILKTYLSFLVQSDYHFAITNAAWLAGPLTTAITNGTLAATGHLHVSSAIGAWIGGQVLGMSMLVWFVAKRIHFGRPDVRLARRSVTFGAKAQVGHALEIGNYRLDQWFVGAFSGSRELGIYSVAVAWAEMLFYLPGVLVMIQRPDLVRAGPQDAARLAQRLLRVTVLIALPLAVFLIVAAPFLCTTVFGAEFADSVPQLRVLALGAVGITFMALLGSALTAQGKPLLTTSADACAFVLTIGLDLALIPPMAGLGAAIATSVAWTGGGLAMAIIFSRALRTDIGLLVPGRADLRLIHSELMTRLRDRSS